MYVRVGRQIIVFTRLLTQLIFRVMQLGQLSHVHCQRLQNRYENSFLYACAVYEIGTQGTVFRRCRGNTI